MCIVVVQDLEDTKNIWHKAEDNSTNDTKK
jgi:hypothetical protein